MQRSAHVDKQIKRSSSGRADKKGGRERSYARNRERNRRTERYLGWWGPLCYTYLALLAHLAHLAHMAYLAHLAHLAHLVHLAHLAHLVGAQAANDVGLCYVSENKAGKSAPC